MTAAARDVDAFLADLDSVLAASTATIPAPAPSPEPAPEPDTAAPTPDITPAPTRRPDPSPMPPAKDWWSDVYKDDTADQDTFTGNTPPPTPPNPTAADDPPPDEPETAETAESDDEPDKDEEEQVEKARAFQPKPGYWPRPHLPAALTHTPDRAETAISHGTRNLLYNATAAGAGWALGLYQPFAHALADCAATTSIGGALVLGIGSTALIAHVWDRRTRHWWPGIAWIARIPLATAILALALWAPAA